MLFCCKICFVAIYAVLSRNLFCHDLRAFRVEKNWTKNCACGEKKTNIRYVVNIYRSLKMQWDSLGVIPWEPLLLLRAVFSLESPCSALPTGPGHGIPNFLLSFKSKQISTLSISIALYGCVFFWYYLQCFSPKLRYVYNWVILGPHQFSSHFFGRWGPSSSCSWWVSAQTRAPLSSPPPLRPLPSPNISGIKP